MLSMLPIFRRKFLRKKRAWEEESRAWQQVASASAAKSSSGYEKMLREGYNH